ncbi:proton-coupled zinc antiporter SLC30A1 [Anolis carolinensis]|uniref:proton-coupled zinc antiporter SLC30A1 n=1 Tax=Anolis carolinensis TaxID=28377 RepID=UPI002F2B6FFA
MGAHLRKKPRSVVDGVTRLTVVVQLCVLLAFFLAEIVASRATGSLLLLSSAFHTLGGALGLAVALADSYVSSGRGLVQRDSFGGARVRVLGTLLSSMFQSSLCLALVPEAVLRVVAPRLTEHTVVLMGVGAMGILVHLVRACLNKRHFQDVGLKPCRRRRRLAQGDGCTQEMEDLLQNGSSGSGKSWAAELGPVEFAKKAGRLLLDGMAACLGPMAVFLYSVTYHLLLQRTPCVDRSACLNDCPACSVVSCWLRYLDPGLAVAVAITLLLFAWPTLRSSSLVLLQAVPDRLDLRELERHLRDTQGVTALRDFHVWQLDGPAGLVATAHVCCLDVTRCRAVIDNVQRVFGEHGIHATTVQPHLGPGSDGQRDATQFKKRLDSCPAEVTEYETTV